MNNQNLLPFRFKPGETSEEAAIIGRKGGLSRSPLKSISAKLRDMKHKGITDETVQKLHDMMISSEAASFEVLKYLLTMQAQAKTIAEKEKVTRLMNEWQKTRHGTKEKSDQIVNLNSIKNYKFVIENTADIAKSGGEIDGAGTENHPLEANKEAEISVELPTRQNND